MNHLIFPAINLAILLGFLVYKTKTPFYKFMKDRHQGVFEGLNRSKLQAQTVAQRKKEVEAKLANLDAERAAIAAEWIQLGVDRTKAMKESSIRVVAQMRAEAEQNKKALETSLHADILRGFRKNVVAQAETKIKQSLNDDLYGRLNQGFIGDVASGVKA